MAQIAIGMTCAPRGGRQYVTDTVESFRAAGFTQRLHVFAEPDSPQIQDTNSEVHQNRERKNCFQNFSQGLRWLLENTEAPWLMMLQDDVIFRDDTAEKMEVATTAWDRPDIGALSPYCSRAMAGRVVQFKKMEIWHDAIFYNKAFWGALALAFPRQAASSMLNHPRWQSHTHYRKVDVLTGNVLRRELGLRVLVHAPSLATHTGQFSTLGRHKVRGIGWGRTGLFFREKRDG